MTTVENSSFLKDKGGLLTNNQHVNSHRVIAIFICQFSNTNTTVGCIDLLKKWKKTKGLSITRVSISFLLVFLEVLTAHIN